MPEPSHEKKSSAKILAELGPYLTLGWQLALSIIMPMGVGYLVDSWLGTFPWFFLGGLLLGMVSVFWQIYQIAQQAAQEESSDVSADSSSETQ